MGVQYGCVVDEQNNYMDYVAVINETPQFYEMKEGERLIQAPPPDIRPHAGAEGFLRPRWVDGAWQETAPAEEIEEFESAHPAPKAPQADPRDLALAQLMREVAQLKMQGVKADV